MSKELAFENATPDLIEQVKKVVADANRRIVSSSVVTKVYNAVFLKNERVDSCPTCLLKKANSVAGWLTRYDVWLAQRHSEADATHLSEKPKRTRKKSADDVEGGVVGE